MRCALNRDAVESLSLSYRCHKQTDDGRVVYITCIPSADDLLWRNFLSPQCRNSSRDPDHAHLYMDISLITRLRLCMADPCTKFEVSSVSRCGDITWGVKF